MKLNHLLEYREKDRVMINNLDRKFNDFQKFVKKEFLETKTNISKLNIHSSDPKNCDLKRLRDEFRRI